ncbi:DUF3306 domain-containing protein [Aliiroseovarius sediminis]|uniref:DUF3306 domain-containing protein n=1 Tax=Aliiroseovarius sediminis TaxID=2925839 RepID=UPI001F5AE409|nr:DUF3306 domain-containing protein [Aliiroseovarius sediminis]MCI2393750.1 DUF3306 domain-containing protein [Aliiroseovarius sediminis]
MSKTATFWDRRRAAVQAEAEAEAQAQAQAALEAQTLAEKSDDDILAELGLPDPDTLVKGDDFTAFMAKAVPEHIRKRALRKLWRSNPVLACVDGLNDYDDDYLAGSYGNAAIATSYQVGKGLLAHVLELDRVADVVAPQDQSSPLDEGDEPTRTSDQVDQQDWSDTTTPETATEDGAEPDHQKPRRMVFNFDGHDA